LPEGSGANELLAALMARPQRTMWQLDQDGNAVAPGEQNPRIARVVEIDPAKIVDEDGNPVNLFDLASFREWIIGHLSGKRVTIEDNGRIALIESPGLKSSLKARQEAQRQAYQELQGIIGNSLYSHPRKNDGQKKHSHLEGQEVYYSAVKISDEYYSVKIVLDIPRRSKRQKKSGEGKDSGLYKGHTVSQIEIAPALYTGQRATPEGARANPPKSDAISGISLSILKGEVKPSRLENGVLYQFAGERSAMSGAVRNNLAEAQVLAEGGTDNEAIRQQTGWFKGMDGKWRYEIPDHTSQIDLGAFNENDETTLGEVYDNPELYEAYPQLEGMRVLLLPLFPGLDGNATQNGYYNTDNKSIVLNSNVSSFQNESTLIHEIQHAIQDIEGFARGGSPGQFTQQNSKNDILNGIWEFKKKAFEAIPERLKEDARRINRGEDEDGSSLARIQADPEAKIAWADYISALEDLKEVSGRPDSYYDGLTPQEQYRLLAGEIEARDSDRRTDMTDTDRAVQSPDLRSDAIVLFGKHPVAAMSIDPMAERAAKVRAIQAMPAKNITPDKAVSNKEDAENLFASWKDIKSPDGFLTTFPKNTVGKIRYHQGFNVMMVMGSLRELFEKSIYIGERQNKGAYIDGSGRQHKDKVSLAGFKDYVNKIADEDGTEYYIRFTSQVEKTSRKNPNKAPRHELHSTAISEITIYKAADTPTQAGHSSPVEGKTTAFVDKVLQDFFNSVNPDLTLEQGARGSVKPVTEGYLISLFKSADLSTLLHETGHVFFEEIEQAVQLGLADESMLRDYNSLRAWLGAQPGAVLNREQREQVARGFEAYLMEGKAPSRELESAFARFKAWLRKIYESAAKLRVELNDEVRGVFDRMLSTEREIAATAARNELIDLTQKQLDAMGVTGPDRKYLGSLMAAAGDVAAERLALDRNRERKDRLARYAKEAREELLNYMVYQARSDIRKTPLDVATVRELYGEEAAKAMPPFSLKNGGADPEIFAAEHGFAGGADMVAQIIASPSLGKAVAERVREKEAAHDAQFTPAEYLLETEQVHEAVAMAGKYLAQSAGRQDMQREAFANIAEQELLSMPMGKAIRPESFLAAMRRALRQRDQAIAKGDFAAALEANHKARLNMEFARKSRDMARRMEVTEGRIKRFVGMSQGDPDARYIVMDIAARYGLAKRDKRLSEGRGPDTLGKWTAEAVSEGFNPLISNRVTQGAVNPVSQRNMQLYGEETPGTWRDMTVEDFRMLDDTINQVVTVERAMRKISDGQREVEFADAVSSIEESIDANGKRVDINPVGKDSDFRHWLREGVDFLTKVEVLCLKLDGGFRRFRRILAAIVG
jgi:hypothetical protein